MASAGTDSMIRLKDGRRLGYATYGVPQGRPLFYFHGFPGCRLEARLGDAVAVRGDILIVSIDRPGIGRSDFKAGRRIDDWPDDVLELADALGIDRFAVIGVSGGGPYSAACALKVPERLTATAIVSGVSPFTAPEATDGMRLRNRLVFGLGRRLPWLIRPIIWLVAHRMRRSPERVLSRMVRALPDPDKAVLARAEVQAMFVDNFTEAFRSGSRGAAWEAGLYLRPWGFRLEDITMEVQLWHGDRDTIVPPAMGRYQAGAIPNCRAKFLGSQGHLLVIDHLEEIQRELLS